MENESDLTPVPTTPVELISSAPNEELAPTDSKLNEDRPAVPEEVAAPLAGGLEEEGGVPGGARDAEGARAEEEERGGEAVALESVAEGKAVGELDTRAEEVAAEKQIDIKVDSTSEAAATAPAVAGSPSEPAVVVEAVDTAVSLVEPIPSKTPSTLTSTLLPSNPPSRAPTPTLTPSGPTPPPPSVSPAPPKKFASSLSVNKKFLEKAGEKSKPEVKAAVARLATPPVVAPVSASHPRLLTGKISSAPAISLSTAQSVPGVTGWTKNAPAAEGVALPTLPTQSVSFNGAGRGGTYERGRGIGGGGMVSRGRGNAVWGSRGAGDANMGIGGDFPTAAEVATAKVMRAAALLEQMQSRDRAVLARAAAAAATNAHLLEGLDAFRGVHLDPNASHWDEMGEDEDDFLDETIEFGDGTQYKIDADTPPPAPPVNRWAIPGSTGAGLAGASSSAIEEEFHDGVSRAEPFKDDFDRSWARPAAGGGDAKNLFNDRLGKLEPYASKAAPGSIVGRGPPPIDMPHSNALRKHVEIDAPPHQERGEGRRRESISSQRSDKGRRDEPRSWTRDAPPARRPSIEHAGQGGRQLPPHLSAANPPRSLERHEPPPHRSTTLSSSPPTRHAQPPSITAVLSPVKSTSTLPAVVPTESATIAAPAAPPPVVVDLEELHAREMHAAAERAKVRRAEEEEARLAQFERAKKKADELAEKMTKPVVVEPARREPLPIPTAAESWRDRRAPSITVAPTPAAVVKVEPIKILAREAPVVSPTATIPPPSSTLPTARPLPPHLVARPTPAAIPARPTPPVVAPRVVEEREWRRESGPTETRSRQAPPHLTAAPSATLPTTLSAVSPPVIEAPVGVAPSISRPEPSSIRATAPTVAKSAARPREISGLDDLMSRIKGVMSLPKEIIADPAQTVLTPGSHSPAAPPTVRLPSLAVLSTPDERPAPTASLPPAAKSRGSRIQSRTPGFEDREPAILFDVTTIERSQSPPPAWKQFIIRLASYPRLSTPSSKQVKSFSNPLLPTRVSIQAPLRRLERHDPLHPKRFINKGQLVIPVTLASHRLVRRTDAEEAVVAAVVLATYQSSSLQANGKIGAKGKGRAPEQGTWRRGAVVDAMEAVLKEVTTTSKPSTADLFLESVPLSRIPSTSAFTGPPSPVEATAAPVDFSREFMVTRELNGEEVLKLVSRGTAPGDGALESPRVASVLTTPIFDPSSLAGPPTWSAPTPLSHSLLDPTLPSVWSAPPIEAATHSRSISLGGLQTANSLQGIADDDFPSAIPHSLTNLKSDDEGSTEEREPVELAGAGKDEARLRAAAPAFASIAEPSSSFDSLPAVDPRAQRYPFIRQPPTQQQNHYQSNPAPPHQYMQSQYPPSSPYSQFPQQQYSPYSPSQSIPNYSPSPMQGYSQSPFAPPSPFNAYRPNPITNNPALLAQSYAMSSYGPIGGAVEAAQHNQNNGRHSFPSRPPVVNSGYNPSGYSNGFGVSPYRGADFSLSQDIPPRHAGGMGNSNVYIGAASPVIMPQHLQHQQSSHLQQQQHSSPPFGSSTMLPGVIGRGGAGGNSGSGGPGSGGVGQIPAGYRRAY